MNNSDVGKNLIWLIVIVLSVAGIVAYADSQGLYSFQELFSDSEVDKLRGKLLSMGGPVLSLASFIIAIAVFMAFFKWYDKRFGKQRKMPTKR